MMDVLASSGYKELLDFDGQILETYFSEFLGKFNKNYYHLIFSSFRMFKKQFRDEKTRNSQDSILLSKLESVEAEFDSVYQKSQAQNIMLKRYVGSLSSSNHKSVYNTLTEKFDKLFSSIGLFGHPELDDLEKTMNQCLNPVETSSLVKKGVKSTAPTLNIVNRSHIEIHSVSTLNKGMQTRAPEPRRENIFQNTNMNRSTKPKRDNTIQDAIEIKTSSTANFGFDIDDKQSMKANKSKNFFYNNPNVHRNNHQQNMFQMNNCLSTDNDGPFQNGQFNGANFPNGFQGYNGL